MKTIYNTISRIGFLAVVGFSGILTGCSNDFDFDEARRENPEFAYKETFEKAFGTIDPNQSWDFASNRPQLGSATRAATSSYDPVIGDYYNVEKATLSWLTNKVKENKDNRSLGTPFAMAVPNNSFTIVPIYQGQAGMTWDLHMVVGTGEDAVDTKIWTKSQGIQTSNNGTSWTNLSTGGNTLNANHVRAKQMTFSNLPAAETMYFYLEITSGMSNWATKGTKQSSLVGMMLALEDCPRPSNIDEKKQVLVIGCEDANLKSSDWDLNDVVFLVIGEPNVPDVIEIDEDTEEKVEKRYMVEDLGATEKTDIDFNDIVIDFKKSRKVTYHTLNGVITNTTYGDWKYSATVRALGGTKNVSVFLGSPSGDNVCIFTKDKYGAPDGSKPNVSWNGSYSNVANLNIGSGATASIMYNTFSSTKEYKGNTDKNYVTTDAGSVIATINLPTSGLTWNPETNNIFVKVYDTDKKSSGVQSAETTKTIVFPANGTVPYMIAVPKTQVWNKERASVFDDDDDENFIKLKEKNNAF